MIIINTDKYNGTKVGVNIFYAAPILQGEHIGKFATSENALKEFPEIFKELEYEVAELEAKHFEIDLTPPTLYGLGVVIPEQYLWAFPNDKFILHGTGFEIPIANTEHGKAVDAAYLLWRAFLDEIWKPEHKTIFEVLEKVWLYLEKEADAENFVQMPK
jgi:hypothetical protein